jgi:hypothetical protein
MDGLMDDIIKTAKETFAECEEAESETRKLFEEDIRFARLGEQWHKEDIEQRKAENRPCLTINKMPSFIRQVVNDSRLNKPAIRVHPVDSGADVETAEIINGIIRNIEVISNADAAYDTAIESAVSGGLGYLSVDIDYTHDDSFDMDIKIDRVINPLTIYGDPRSQAVDSSDWNVAFQTELLPESEFKRLYPDAEFVDWENTTEEDRNSEWREEKSVRIADYWTRDEVEKELLKLSNGELLYADDLDEEAREVMQASGIEVVANRKTKTYEVKKRIITGAEVLKEEKWAGKFIPIIPVYGDEVIIGGKRQFHSLIHFAVDPQRMFNYWRTAATELVALAPKAPWVGPQGAFDDDDNWQTANTRSHAYLTYNGPTAPQRQPFAGVPAGHLQEAMNASDDMKSVMGIYDASLGARSNETSGKAIMARQREGDVSTFHFIDNLSRAIRQTGRVIVDLIPHVYNEERVMRIMGEDQTPSTVEVNKPVPVMENGQPVMENTPQGPQPKTRIYALTTGKYDVTVKSGPSFTSKREESATQMMELIRMYPQAAPVIGDLLVKNLDWPGADEIAERLKGMVPQQAQGQDPEKQKMQQVIQQGAQKIQELETDRSADQAKLQIDAQKVAIDREKVEIEKYKAETDRMQAVHSMSQPVPTEHPFS